MTMIAIMSMEILEPVVDADVVVVGGCFAVPIRLLGI